ncbi:hypothetical protein [Pseudomonas phage vB_Pa-PAC2]
MLSNVLVQLRAQTLLYALVARFRAHAHAYTYSFT